MEGVPLLLGLALGAMGVLMANPMQVEDSGPSVIEISRRPEFVRIIKVAVFWNHFAWKEAKPQFPNPAPVY